MRLELAPGEGADRYGYVADTQRRWEAEGILMRDEEPSIYVTEESFEVWWRGADAAWVYRCCAAGGV